MALDIKEALKQIAASKVNGGGEFIKGGTYVLELNKILFDQMRKGLSFIGEFTVVEAQATANNEPNKVGASVSTVINFHGAGLDMAGVNVKSLVCGLLDMDPATVSEDDIIDTIAGGEVDEGGKKVQVPGLKDASQPGRGMLVKCVAVPITTKSGNPFTKLVWHPVKQTAEEIQARRAIQEGKKAA